MSDEHFANESGEEPLAENTRQPGELTYDDPKVLAKSYGTYLRGDLDTLRDRLDIGADVLDAHLESTASAFNDANIAPSDAVAVHALITKHLLEPADATQQREWAVESRRHLREQYGDGANATLRLQRVQQFIASRPGLQETLDNAGLLDHPDIVRRLAANAFSLKAPRKRGS